MCTLFQSFNLGVRTDGLLALGAGVGAQLVEALDAHVLVVLLHVLLAVQVVAAVEAVGAVGHGGGEVTPGTCGSDRERESPFQTPEGGGVASSSRFAGPPQRKGSATRSCIEVSHSCCCC